MVTFTINDDNNITAYASAEEAAQAGGVNATTFESQATLTKISSAWPLRRLVEIWNSIPGNREVKKFADRKKAVARIWKAIQPLAGNGQVGEPAGKPRKPAKRAKPARKIPTTTKHKVAAKKTHDESERRNKKREVMAMMKRTKGVTLAQIQEATGWQAHTVRGFVSLLASKGGEKIESFRSAIGERTYHIAK